MKEIPDFDKKLTELKLMNGPLTYILSHMDSTRIIPVGSDNLMPKIEWIEDTLYPGPCIGESCPCRIENRNRIGGTI